MNTNTAFHNMIQFAKTVDAQATSETAIWNLFKAGTISYDVADFMTDGRGYMAARGAELIYGTGSALFHDDAPGCVFCGRILPVGASGCTDCNEYKGVLTWEEMNDFDAVNDFLELHFIRSLDEVAA